MLLLNLLFILVRVRTQDPEYMYQVFLSLWRWPGQTGCGPHAAIAFVFVVGLSNFLQKATEATC